ncbi:MAG: nucleotidyltransferase family protein [Actinomycetota bacterium]|nr:nucleotidyltransferase family protein [Actinomycetota bacterium]
MRRATITLPEGLDRELERFRQSQPAHPSLTAVVRSALASYLRQVQTPEPAASALHLVLRNRPEMRRIVSEHGGSHPRLFGSVARGEDGSESDIDLMIDLEPGRTLFDLAAMRADLEELLGRPVDVIPASGLGGHLRDEVLAEALAL